MSAADLSYEALRARVAELEQQLSSEAAARAAAEDALRECVGRFDAAFELMPVALALTTLAEGRVLAVNHALEALFGYALGNLEGLSALGSGLLADPEEAARVRARVARGEVVRDLHTRVRHKDGGLRSVAYCARLVPVSGVPCILSAIVDTTEQELAEESLRACATKWRGLFAVLPVGVSVLDDEHALHEMNPALRRILALSEDQVRDGAYRERRYLRADGTPLAPEDLPSRRALAEHRTVDGVEIGVVKEDGDVVWTEVSAAPLPLSEATCVLATVDITERKRAERYREVGREILQILNEAGALKDAMPRVLATLKSGIGCDAVGMRLQEGDDFPYFVADGFSQEFLLAENSLLLRRREGGVCRDTAGTPGLACTCGLTISGTASPNHPLFTRGGSFWTNDSPTLLDVPPEEDERLEPRNRCIHQGYASVALVPIRCRGKIVGLIQLNDRRRGRFTAGAVELLEGIAAHVGAALMRKQAEDALRESEERYKVMLECMPIAVSITRGADILYVNPRYLEMFEFASFAEVKRAQPFERFAPESRARVGENIRRHAAGLPVPASCEAESLRKDGTRIPVLMYLTSAAFADGPATLVFHLDITERKRAEEALRHSESRLRLALGAAQAGSWEWNLATNENVWSEEVWRLYGLDARHSPASYESWRQAIHPEDRAALEAAVHNAAKTGSELLVEWRVNRSAGAPRWLISRGQPERDASGAVVRYVGIVMDITERKQAEEARRLSQQRLSVHVEQTPLAVIEFDIHGHVREWNPAAEAIFGYAREEAIGRPWTFVAPEAVRGRLEGVWADIVAQRGGNRAASRNVTKDGRTIWCEWFNTSLLGPDGESIGVASLVQDVTERKRAEDERDALHAQMLQAQKMEAIGRLAGGVAHDFNNMLSVILNDVDFALEQVPPSKPLHADLQDIRTAARRSADLTRQLLGFARKQTVVPKVLRLNETVAGMLSMLRRLVGEDLELVWRPGADLWAVRVDPSQIDQVLANLCVNARDAIADIGKVTITTENRTLSHAACAERAGFVPGDYVVLSVGDSGCGMDADTLAHLFEPFFTTKEVGAGTGLGLATVYGIVKQNNGFIDVDSRVGHGTEFTIYLPRHAGGEVHAEAPSAQPAARGQEVILLVEDEPAILRSTRRLLERCGYSVVAAGTPAEAMRRAREHRGVIDLLVSDVVMPEMNGRDLAAQLLALYPGMKRMFMSGYTADVIAHHGVLDDGVSFVQKPFSAHDLAAEVRRALDRERSG